MRDSGSASGAQTKTGAAGPQSTKRQTCEDGNATRPNKRFAAAVAANRSLTRVALPATSAQPTRVAPVENSPTPKQAMLSFLLRRKAMNLLTPAQAAALKNLQEDGPEESGVPPSPSKKQRLG